MKQIAITLMVSLMAIATTFGTVVEKALNVTQRISITPETQQIVLFLDLPAGDWNINASLNLFVYGDENTKVYYASYLSPLIPFIDYQNGRTALGSETLHADPSERIPGRADIVVPLVGRRITIDAPPGTTKRVYLMVWVHTRSGTGITRAQTYGFAYAKTQ